MIEKLAGLWENNKILFFILLPITLLAVGFQLYRKYQVMQAKASLEEAEKTHEELDKEKRKALKQAEKAELKARLLAEKRKQRKDSDIPTDWHKKDK